MPETAPIAPATVRYIKLGPSDRWAATCLQHGALHFGYRTVPHELCVAGDWESVTQLLVREGRSLGKARDALREIRDFYSLGADCLWITFAEGHLWWCFAEPDVLWRGENPDGGPRLRRTKGPWSKLSTDGQPLRIDSLSSRLTQVSAYRQTICAVKEVPYLLRRINCAEEPVVLAARQARDTLVATVAELIAGLHWTDFETLVDLIFARSGWQRIALVGGTQKDTDLVLREPVTGETAFVQIKSKTTQAVLDEYIARYKASGHNRMFFVSHSAAAALRADHEPYIQVWDRILVAEKAVSAGLVDWLLDKAR